MEAVRKWSSSSASSSSQSQTFRLLWCPYGIVTFRKHLCAYLKPFSDPLELRPKLLRETDPQVQKALVEQFFSETAPAH